MATVKIPDEIYKEIEKIVKDSGEFKDVDEYVIFVLTEVLKEEDEDEEQVYTEEDEEKIKERLRGLGYL